MKSGFVSLVGSPNVGKSSFLNAMIKRKVSIISDKPQTTRDMIKGIYTKDDVQVVFLDTPGFHKAFNKLNEYMNEQIERSLYDIDLIIYMLDAKYGIGRKEVKNLQRLSLVNNIPIVAVINKIDLVSQEEVLKITKTLEQYEFIKKVIAMSVTDFFDEQFVIEQIKPYLTGSDFYYDEKQFYDYPEHFFISEIIREKVYQFTGEEIPYSSSVRINEIYDNEQGIKFIEADILVERDSQKGIIIGQSGKMIKKIGTVARKEIKQEYDQPIYLDLRVKVMSKWGQEVAKLESLGYSLE